MTQESFHAPLPPSSSLSSFVALDVKSPAAFRTISEVATDLEVPQHVLRFWESKFQQIRPLKRGGGRRYYRPEDIQVISNIKDLLYNQGFTIRGVQKLLKDNGKPSSGSATQRAAGAPVQQALNIPPPNTSVTAGLSKEKRLSLEIVLQELRSLRDLLKQNGI